MLKYRLIHKYLAIDKPIKDVIHAISNSFGAFGKDISYSLLSSDDDLLVLKLHRQDKSQIFNPYITILINTEKKDIPTELEVVLYYKSKKGVFKGWFQKRKIQRMMANSLSEFKKRCEKWL